MSAQESKRWCSGDDAQRAAWVAPLVDPSVPPGAKARVRARLKAPQPSPRGTLAWPLAGAAVVVALAIVVTRGPGAAPAPSAVGLHAAAPKVWRAPDDRPRIERIDLGQFELSPGSKLVRMQDERPELVLERGSVRVVTAQSKLQIVAGGYRLVIPESAEARVAAEPFALFVRRGAVRVVGGGGERVVEAGGAWPPDDETVAVDEALTASSRRRAPRPATVPATAAAPSVPPSKAPGAAPVGAALGGPGGPRAEAAPVDMGAVYRAARAASDDEVAVAAFDRVLEAGGPWAEMAGHQAVRRRMGQGRYDDALARLDALEARFAHSAYAPEVWLARVEIRVAEDALPRAREDIERYLAALPDSLRAQEMYFLRGELSRAAGDLAAAAADYRQVQRGPYASAARAALEKIEEGVKAPGASAHE